MRGEANTWSHLSSKPRLAFSLVSIGSVVLLVLGSLFLSLADIEQTELEAQAAANEESVRDVTDLLPTFCALAGIDVPGDLDLEGEAGSERWQTLLPEAKLSMDQQHYFETELEALCREPAGRGRLARRGRRRPTSRRPTRLANGRAIADAGRRVTEIGTSDRPTWSAVYPLTTER